ncbi:unnamed protein product [Tuber aestivum]|uniref:Uncharacterized protein n=1 Tax=Tuber aestivum TaxID=59557 RepID=A0A292PMS5_9PEZI|nr:unnamed protein product [Tuber aestivum]
MGGKLEDYTPPVRYDGLRSRPTTRSSAIHLQSSAIEIRSTLRAEASPFRNHVNLKPTITPVQHEKSSPSQAAQSRLRYDSMNVLNAWFAVQSCCLMGEFPINGFAEDTPPEPEDDPIGLVPKPATSV